MAGGSRFAGAVLLGDLDDIIAPSQSCVNPLFTSGTETAPSEASAAVDGGSSGRAKVSLELDDDVEMGRYRGLRGREGEKGRCFDFEAVFLMLQCSSGVDQGWRGYKGCTSLTCRLSSL